MIPGWHSGHGVVPSGHFASEQLSEVAVSVGKLVRGYLVSDALDDSASSSRDLILSRRGLDFIGAGWETIEMGPE
jgi:hypothetical protein